MRVKTDDRRQAILDAACAVFREEGFERASMAAISARAGGSKTTLYSYFKSKEELFVAAMVMAMVDQGQEIINLLDSSNPDVRAVLERFGRAFLRFITDPDALALIRTAINEGGKNSSLGPDLYALGPKRCWGDVADYMSRLQAQGLLQSGDPAIIAMHFKGLLESGLIEPLLFGAPADFEIATSAPAAVAAFLKIYGAGAA